MRSQNRLIKAHHSIHDSIEIKRSELLSVLLLTRGLIMFCVLIYLTVIGPPDARPGLFGAIVINLGAYLVTRTRHFRWGAALVIVEGLIFIPATVIQIPTFDVAAAAPLWLGLGTLISSLVLPMRHTIVTILATAAAFVVIRFNVDPKMLSAIYGIFLFTMASSILALVGTYLRDRSDQMLEVERAKVIHVSKLSALGEMAGGIAHEINTPLGAMILSAEMIELRNAALLEDADITARTKSIVTMGHRVAKLIQSLKGFSRDANADEMKNFSIKELVDQTLELCSEKFLSHGVKLKIQKIPNHLQAHGRSVELSQTLLNLLNNSYDAIQEFSDKWIEISVNVRGQQLELRVTDSGRGLSAKTVERLFQPFFTTKDVGKGTGLGLSIARGIVRHHKGDLFYDTKIANTCFVISLPLPQQDQQVA